MLQMDWFVSSLLPYIGGLRNLRSFAVANKANLFIISSLGSCLSCKAACLALFAIFPDIPIMIPTVSLADVQTLSDLAAKLNVPRPSSIHCKHHHRPMQACFMQSANLRMELWLLPALISIMVSISI